MINYIYINHQAKFIETRLTLQIGLNLAIFGRNKGNFRKSYVSVNIKF